MSTDYTPAIAGLAAVVVLLTGMVLVVLAKPSDLAPRP
jgi:hypothetical protein